MIMYDMAEAEGIRETEDSSFPRDLLQGLVTGNHFPIKFEEKTPDVEDDVELSLGLSLNGRFGVDPERPKNLIRSSSISSFMNSDENKACSAAVAAYAPLTRTCSLPLQPEEEWRKRKELQSLRRMEAKRKRLEKLKNVRVVRDKVDSEGNCEENGRAVVLINRNGERVSGGDLEGLLPPQAQSQGSIGSQGSGSSGISDFQSQPIRGKNRDSEMRSPARVQSLPEQTEQKSVTPGTTNDKPGQFARAVLESPSSKVAFGDEEANEMLRNMMVDMPCVCTRGDGPNGRRIEGFLYRYRKGEEVRIVCVCHGSFLTPAEFVKHGGGGDVAHPLKHIVVKPSPFL